MNLLKLALLLAPLALVACGSSASTEVSGGGDDAGGSMGDRDSGSGKGHDGGSAGEGGTSGDGSAGDSGISLGAPITAKADTWTWVPFADASCANGTPTGLGVNLTGKPGARALIYLEGGGACWSDVTCYTFMTAVNFSTGYGEANFTADTASELALPGGFFDRTAAANPFKDYDYVYVPYCTGDIHAGNNVYAYPSGTAHHV